MGSGSSGNSVVSRARSRSRSRLPKDRDNFDNSDCKSICNSVGGASIYNDSKSKSRGFGGNYDGDLNSRGERNGYGVFIADNGNAYEGAWNNGFKDGPGTYRWKDGEVDISRYSSDYRTGEGVRWSEDRRCAFRLVRGNVQEEIDLREADRISKGLGLPPP